MKVKSLSIRSFGSSRKKFSPSVAEGDERHNGAPSLSRPALRNKGLCRSDGMVDMADLSPAAFGREGSTPFSGSKI